MTSPLLAGEARTVSVRFAVDDTFRASPRWAYAIGLAMGQASISTMHLAKGMEFRAVAVMACDDLGDVPREWPSCLLGAPRAAVR